MVFDIKMLLRVLLALLTAGALSLILTPMVKYLAERVGAIDVPKDDRRMHKTPIPRMGGLAIFLAFFLSTLLYLRVIDRQMQAVLLALLLIVILGVFDDIYDLHPIFKLLIQIAAACIVIFYGNLRIEKITNPFGGEKSFFELGFFSVPVTLLWIVAITNAVNFIDGLDGLACGVSCITAINMLVIALLVSEKDLMGSERSIAIVMAALAGACLGFLPYNFNPAKIFMGDTGSTFLGFLLATVSIQGLFKAYAVVSVAVPFLLLGLPIFDISAAVIRRLAHGKNPMQADRGHFHHKLIDMGLSQKQTVAVAYVLTAVLGLATVLLTSTGRMKTVIVVLAVAIVGMIGFQIFSSDRIRKHQAAEKAQNTEQSAETEAGDEHGSLDPGEAKAACGPGAVEAAPCSHSCAGSQAPASG